MRSHLQEARPGEAKAISKFITRSKAHWDYPESWMKLWKDDLTVTESELQTIHAYWFCQNGEVVGFFALKPDEPQWELEHFWLSPSRIGQGLGAGMWEAMAGRLKSFNRTQLRVVSDPNAQGFYERMGGTHVWWVPGVPAGRRLPLLTFQFE